MVTIQLPPDFKEFLKLLNSHQVEYLLIGGYAVGYHGYPRATGAMDLWVAGRQNNAEKLVAVLREFGFMVDFRITWTLPIGEVSKPRLLGLEKSGL